MRRRRNKESKELRKFLTLVLTSPLIFAGGGSQELLTKSFLSKFLSEPAKNVLSDMSRLNLC